MKRLSVTSIATYLECPRRYRYSYRDYLPCDDIDRRRRYALSSIVHNALTAFHAGQIDNWEALDTALLENWEPSVFTDRRESADRYHSSRWALWESFHAVSGGNPVRFGYSFDTDFGGGKFRGRIDRIDDSPVGLIVTDYTTTAFDASSREWRLQTYGAVLGAVFRKRVAVARAIEVFGRGRTHEFAQEDPTTVEYRIAGLRRSIESDSDFTPNPGEYCRRCPYEQICESAPGRSANIGRPGDLYPLFRAVEYLMAAQSDAEAFHLAAADAIRVIDEDAKIYPLENYILDATLRAAVTAGREVEGSLATVDGRLELRAGSDFISPVGHKYVVAVTEKADRIAAEILARNIRLAWQRFQQYERAAIDGLTGLKRREVFDAEVDCDAELSLIICDIDRFKGINDTFGHPAGDTALRAFASLLKSQAGAVAYRLGGEEFGLLVPTGDARYLVALAETLRAGTEAIRVRSDNNEIRITASFGIAPHRAGDSPSDMLRRADKALYDAKSGGRNRWILSQ